MNPEILILDFGSQYTQLIARRVRELNVFCEIHPFSFVPKSWEGIKGVILSGSPCSVHDEGAPAPAIDIKNLNLPVLGVCYGAQWLAKQFGGSVGKSASREYGRAQFFAQKTEDPLLRNLGMHTQVWMSHGDTITALPEDAELLGSTDSVEVAAYKFKNKPVYALQFHPEVTHSLAGKELLSNFLFPICGCSGDWTPAHFVEDTVASLKAQLGNDEVILGLSGGVDSTVAAVLLNKAIGNNLHCIFIDNGLLRLNEYEAVLDSYKGMGLNVTGINAQNHFYSALAGVEDPEIKRKTIGRVFIEVFEREAKRLGAAKWLAQGTIYPDVIESVSVKGPSVTIKSHHNVGGLPERMHLKVVEPLRMLFKDEVRRVGRQMGIGEELLGRHPFPGPGLAIRILGDITQEKVELLQKADAVFINLLKAHSLYDHVWQAGAILLPIKSVGVMGDERSYEQVIALRAVQSTDGMTADWVHLPYAFLAEVSNEIINKVRGINRVVYDISSKPPATIEWE